jgi:hypothetical protein
MRTLGALFLSLLLVLALVTAQVKRRWSREAPKPPSVPARIPPVASAPTPPPAQPVSQHPLPPPPTGSARCWAYEYQLAPSSRIPELEDYLDATSLLPLPPGPVNDKTLCVKADGRIVSHRLLRDQGRSGILLGPVIGPDTRVRVSFCTPGARCAEKCQKKEPSFMDGLMDDAQPEEPETTGNQKPQDADLRELRARAKELKAIARNDADLSGSGTLRNWTLNQQQEWSCKE